MTDPKSPSPAAERIIQMFSVSDDPDAASYRQAVLDFGDDEIYVIAMETRLLDV